MEDYRKRKKLYSTVLLSYYIFMKFQLNLKSRGKIEEGDDSILLHVPNNPGELLVSI
jgi:hypothetical protein